MNKENNALFITKLALILFAITFIATLMLTVCNALTKDKIAELEEKNAQLAMQEVIPNGEFEKISVKNTEFDVPLEKNCNFNEAFTAKIDGKLEGYCLSVSSMGFGGDIKMFVGIKPDGKSITGIKIISMSETPGLGAKAQEKQWYGKFSDKKVAPLKVLKNISSEKENEICAISGATITSRAVTDGANYACEILGEIAKEVE